MHRAHEVKKHMQSKAFDTLLRSTKNPNVNYSYGTFEAFWFIKYKLGSPNVQTQAEHAQVLKEEWHNLLIQIRILINSTRRCLESVIHSNDDNTKHNLHLQQA